MHPKAMLAREIENLTSNLMSACVDGCPRRIHQFTNTCAVQRGSGSMRVYFMNAGPHVFKLNWNCIAVPCKSNFKACAILSVSIPLMPIKVESNLQYYRTDRVDPVLRAAVLYRLTLVSVFNYFSLHTGTTRCRPMIWSWLCYTWTQVKNLYT